MPANLHIWKSIAVEPMNDLVTRQVIHTASMTVSRLVLKKGAVVPRHSHPNEQITNVESGSLRFLFDDGEVLVKTGESLEIPGDLAHAVEALEDSVALDLFAPPREDWIRGDDAYLRRGR
jgi:quercetin dioxygenase-like cupin family protein